MSVLCERGKNHLCSPAKWNRIKLSSPTELNLEKTLNCGQSFTWLLTNDKPREYSSVMKNTIITLRQEDNEYLEYKTNSSREEVELLLEDYFRLNVNLTSLYQQWSKKDKNFKRKAKPGVRVLRIDPVENLFSFICSSNNNIPRIKSMVEKLCREYGEWIGREGEVDLYSFPECSKLIESEGKLRDLGFGYRAKYISESALLLTEMSQGSPSELLKQLRHKPYGEVKRFLMQLKGVGEKVADCICLMSMDKLEAIPVDTHVRQIAERDYGIQNVSTGLTPKLYLRIQEKFYEIFGFQYSGWAHSVLFSRDIEKKKIKKKTKKKLKKTK